MSRLPAQPKIYHILHVDRLPSVINQMGLWCDASMRQHPDIGTTIGISRIKQRRLGLSVKCYPGDYVGDYVPFYFCPRSIMLYMIYRANDPDLAYRGGQEPIIHLQVDLYTSVAWAGDNNQRWAFSLSNAGAQYAEFYSQLNDLDKVNWAAVAARNWSNPELKEGKQAEFLFHRFFPWSLVEQIGVHSQHVAIQVAQILASAEHRPELEVRPEWYY